MVILNMVGGNHLRRSQTQRRTIVAEPVETPITGSEVMPPDDPRAALVEFYRAFNARDLALMAQNWSQGSDTSMDNPLGGIRRGWAEIRCVYQRLFTGSARVQVAFHGYTLRQFGETFIAVGRERGVLTTPGQTLQLAIRTTRVFRRVGGTWRQVHHHGSIDDPALLRAYQEAVL